MGWITKALEVLGDIIELGRDPVVLEARAVVLDKRVAFITGQLKGTDLSKGKRGRLKRKRTRLTKRAVRLRDRAA